MSKNEFLNFMSFDKDKSSHNPLSHLIQRDLERQSKNVLLKSLLTYLVTGGFTLLFCPQFGFNPFGASVHTAHIFMGYGVWACGLFCGTLFMMFGSFFLPLILNHNEMAFLYRRPLKTILPVSSIIFALLMLGGINSSAFDMFFSFSFIIFWIVGAFSIILLELSGIRLLREKLI